METLQPFTILRMLTPSEVQELTASSSGEAFSSLTDMMLERIHSALPASHKKKEEAAKILPFEKPVASSAPDEIDQRFQAFEERSASASERQQEAKRKAMDAHVHFSGTSVAFEEEEVIEEQIETSVFILAEQRKLKKSQKRLKGQEVLQLYQKNAAVSVEQEKQANQDMSKSTNSGILINKKRY